MTTSGTDAGQTEYSCHICGALLVGRKCGSCGHTQCDECPACAPQETRKQLIERIDDLESYKHNADHALNLAIEENRELREQVSALRHEIDLRVEQGQALNQDKDHFKGNTLKVAFAELRAVNERLVQDVKRHMEREDALRLALEEAAQSLRTIEQKAGKDEFLIDIFDVRGYAYSRASAARAALEATK